MGEDRMPRPSRSHRILDFVVYIAIGTTLCAAVIAMAMYSDLNGHVVFKWVALAANTAVAFYYPLSGIPSRLRIGRVWATWSALLTVHITVYSVVLSKVEQWPGFYFLLITVFELGVISAALKRVGGGKKDQGTSGVPGR